MAVNRDRAWWNALTSGVALALLAIHLWSLMRFPPPFVDEAWFGSRAWSLLTRGDTLGTLDYGVVDRVSGSRLFFPLLPVVIQAAAQSASTSPSLRSLRLVSLACGAIVAWAVWRIARSRYDAATGIIALVLLGLSNAFLYSSHLARYDIMAAACGYGGIALYLSNDRRQSIRATIAGAAAGLAIEFHPFGVVVAAGFAVLVLYDARGRIYSNRLARIALLSLLVGAAVYPLIHVVPNPQTYLELSRVIYGPSHLPVAKETAAGLRDAALLAYSAMTTASLLVPFALLLLVRSSSSTDKTIAIVAVSIGLAFVFIVRNKLDYYAILFVPALALCVAAAIRNVAKRFESAPVPAIAVLTVAIVVILEAEQRALRLLDWDGYAAFQSVQEQLRLVIRPADTVMGSQTYWFAFAEHTYYSWEQLIYIRRAEPELSMPEALGRMRPDVFLRDGHLDGFILDEPGPTLYRRLLRLPKHDLEGWLADHGKVISDFDGGLYGRVRAYRISWPTVATDVDRRADSPSADGLRFDAQ